MNGLNQTIQRLLALLGLAALSPVLLLVGLAIRLETEGPVFFRQVRVGQDGRRFSMFKFRSMYQGRQRPEVHHNASDREGVCAKFRNDPRVTRVGRLIRKTSVDELPQLINVVRGEMGLVGPRPGLIEEVEAYEGRALDRLNVLPGLTGLWQVSGRADTTFSEQVALDLRYVTQRSAWLDLKILMLTVPAVVSGRGAY